MTDKHEWIVEARARLCDVGAVRINERGARRTTNEFRARHRRRQRIARCTRRRAADALNQILARRLALGRAARRALVHWHTIQVGIDPSAALHRRVGDRHRAVERTLLRNRRRCAKRGHTLARVARPRLRTAAGDERRTRCALRAIAARRERQALFAVEIESAAIELRETIAWSVGKTNEKLLKSTQLLHFIRTGKYCKNDCKNHSERLRL